MNKCTADVWDSGAFRPRQCAKAALEGRSVCRTHSQEYKDKAALKHRARYEEKMRPERRKWAILNKDRWARIEAILNESEAGRQILVEIEEAANGH